MRTGTHRASHEERHVSRLVVAPHAGDEALGCGGMIARHADDCAVVVLAQPDPTSLQRLTTAHWMLGNPESTILGLSDGPLAAQLDQIVGMLAELIRRLRPTQLYLPYPSLHLDHLVTYEAGMRATRTPGLREVCPPLSVLVYDVGATTAAQYPADVRWGVCEPLVEDDVARKVSAAVAYRSGLARGLKDVAREVGAARGLPWAEQFALVRSTVPVVETRPSAPPTAEPVMTGGVR
jgi:LmbE family N-acetylglucosaminyl deacetylase